MFVTPLKQIKNTLCKTTIIPMNFAQATWNTWYTNCDVIWKQFHFFFHFVIDFIPSHNWWLKFWSKMGSRIELEKLKKILQNNIKTSDVDGFRKNVENFYDRYKSILKPEELVEVQKLLANVQKPNKLIPTYHEFVLFFIIITFMILALGENMRINRLHFSILISNKMPYFVIRETVIYWYFFFSIFSIFRL